jgi:hypothetical protein
LLAEASEECAQQNPGQPKGDKNEKPNPNLGREDGSLVGHVLQECFHDRKKRAKARFLISMLSMR